MPSQNTPPWAHLLPWALAALVGMVYLPVLELGYVWDDWELFVNNPALHTWDLAWDAILQPIIPASGFFRPLVLGSFSLEFLGLGVIPSVSHGINLAIHLANTILVGLLGLRLTALASLSQGLWRVIALTLLYGLHPALIEPVAWVVGRFDLLVTFFMLLCFWGYLALRGWGRDIWVALCFLLAALSKEMAVTLPFLLILFYLGRLEGGIRWRDIPRAFLASGEWRLYLMLGLASGVVLLLRHMTLGHIGGSSIADTVQFAGPLQHLAFIGQTWLFFLRMSLWPFADLNPQHLIDPAALGPVEFSLGLAAFFSAMLALNLLIRARRWPALLLAGWLMAFLPVLNIITLPTGGNIGHDRYLTLPLALLVLGLGTLPAPPVSVAMKRALPWLLGGSIVLYLGFSVANIRVTLPLWSNEFTLWSWVYARHPQAPKVQLNYISAAISAGELDKAKEALDRLKEPLSFQLAAVKGRYLLAMNRPEEALAPLHSSVAPLLRIHEKVAAEGGDIGDASLARGNPMWWVYQASYTNLGHAYLGLGDYERARDHARIALFYAPRYPTAWVVWSLALYGLDQWEEGEAKFTQALDYLPLFSHPNAKRQRNDFLVKLCEGAEVSPVLVCDKWHQELASRPLPD